MSSIKVNCGNIEISNNNKICIIAGPCQLETEQHAMEMAGKIKEITKKFNLGFIYKTSFDKANRTSLKGKRGAGLEASIPIFDKIKKELDVPILTDIHNVEQCSILSNHVDILQIPAFLCRQTDLLIAAAKTNKIINVKKGQFLAPWDMINVTKKISDSGNENILVTERGASFGYNTLVSDMRSLPIMAKNGYQHHIGMSYYSCNLSFIRVLSSLFCNFNYKLCFSYRFEPLRTLFIVFLTAINKNSLFNVVATRSIAPQIF